MIVLEFIFELVLRIIVQFIFESVFLGLLRLLKGIFNLIQRLCLIVWKEIQRFTRQISR